MERSPSEHIGTADLAKLLEKSRQRADSVLDAPDVHPHLALCPTCREQFEELALLERQLDRQLSLKPVELPTSNMPAAVIIVVRCCAEP